MIWADIFFFQQSCGCRHSGFAFRKRPAKPTPANKLHYVLVKMYARWRIDDVSGMADGKPWSLSRLLEDFDH